MHSPVRVSINFMASFVLFDDLYIIITWQAAYQKRATKLTTGHWQKRKARSVACLPTSNASTRLQKGPRETSRGM